jgi:selenocysteine lyase/cysteine desulfurase
LQIHAASTATQRNLVLLDAAAYVPTHRLDLKAAPADFVAMSFYKMFGYPTGLGALVFRTDVVPMLHKVGGWGRLQGKGTLLHFVICSGARDASKMHHSHFLVFFRINSIAVALH